MTASEKKSGDTLYIVIPAYNEQDNIEDVVKDWHPIVEKYGSDKSKLVIINDGSKDNTYKILKKLEKDYPRLEAIDKKNSGHGGTVLFGYKYALDHGADYIFQTDSDGQTLPSEFDDFWKLRENYDCIIGHRSERKDGLSRVFVTRTLRRVIKMCFGVWVIDANTPYRLMKAEGLRENIKYIPDNFNLSNVILQVIYAKRKTQRVKYMKITFRPRQGGVNSINFKKIIKIGKQALKDFKEINRNLKSLED